MVKRAEVVAVNDKLDTTVARQTLREKMNHHQIQRAEKRSRPGAGGLEAGALAGAAMGATYEHIADRLEAHRCHPYQPPSTLAWLREGSRWVLEGPIV